MSYLKPVLLLAISICFCQAAAAHSDTGTLLVGAGPLAACGEIPLPEYFGYLSSPAIGSYSPTGLTGGDTVADLADSSAGICTATFSIVVISGFSSSPGQSWLTSVKCGNVTNAGSSATYKYNGGFASWQWSTQFGFVDVGSHNVSCTIVHN